MASPAAPTDTGRGPGTRRAHASRRRASRGGRRRGLTPWLFLLLPLALLVLFTYIPVYNMVGYSFTNWDGLSPVRRNVGLRNYTRVLTTPEYLQVFVVSLYYLAGSVIQIALALYFATLLSGTTRFRNLFKGVLFFPYLLNGVAISFVFLYLFQPGGTLDTTLNVLGLHSWTRQWLGDPHIVNWSLTGTSVWRYMGMNFVLFLGAIQSIPSELYEAATVDGANAWGRFRYIVLPGIRRILSLSVILAVSGSLSVFEVPYIMTGGANGSQTFVIKTVDSAFKYNKVGLASAMGMVLLAVVLVITGVQRLLVPDERVDLS